MESTIRKCVIITTINEPTETIYAHIANKCYDVIIVGDKKTPSTYKSLDCIYIDIEKQKELYPELADLIPYNHYCRKNLGYLYAIQNNYKIIYETDDDNIPYTQFDSILCHKPTYMIEEKQSKWINIFKYFTQNAHIWPRGYPLTLVKSESQFEIQETQHQPSIVCGLVENDPDVDSIFRLTAKQEVKWEKDKYILVSNKNTCPFNTQNTFWLNKDLFVCMLIPSTVSFRYCDILRGIIASEILKYTGNSLMFTSPNVRQDRNEHNLINDFKSEVEMFLQNETILDGLEETTFLYLIQAKGRLPTIYDCLRNKPHILLSYKEETIDTHIFFQNSTWTTGRNKLREYVLQKGLKFDYYVFLDEDVVFEETDQQNGFVEFERLVKKYNPLIATPNYNGYYDRTYKFLPSIEEAQNTVWLDGLFNAFAYEIFHSNIVFPYVDKFDPLSWWASQYILIALSYTYNKEITVFNFLKIKNTQGTQYPKGEYQELANKYLDEYISSQTIEAKYNFEKDFLKDKKYTYRILQPSIQTYLLQIYRKLLEKNIIKELDMEIVNKWLEYFK